MYAKKLCNFWQQKCHSESSQEDFKTKSMWVVKTNVIPVKKKRDNWKHLKIIQNIPDQQAEKAQNQGTTENSHIGHRIHTPESANVKVQNTQHGK